MGIGPRVLLSLKMSILIPPLRVGIRIRQVPRNFVGFIITRREEPWGLAYTPFFRTILPGGREGEKFRCVSSECKQGCLWYVRRTEDCDIDNRNLACGRKRALLAFPRAIKIYSRDRKSKSLTVFERGSGHMHNLDAISIRLRRHARGKYYHVHRGVSLQDYLSTLTARVYSLRRKMCRLFMEAGSRPLPPRARRCDPVGKFLLRFPHWCQCGDATWSRTSRNNRTWRTRVSTRTWRQFRVLVFISYIIAYSYIGEL